MNCMQKILIVDDNDRNLDLLEDILEELDAVIVKALSGEEALEKMKKEDFSLISVMTRQISLAVSRPPAR